MTMFIFLCILLVVFRVKGESVNVAFNQTCVAFVHDNLDSDCLGAIDGVSASPSPAFRWAFFGDPTGTWIKVTFSRQQLVTSARLMQLYFEEETNFQNISLQFESSAAQQFSFSERLEGYTWDTFILDPPVLTTFVNISILSTFELPSSTPYSGFSEIEFYAAPITDGDMVACAGYYDPSLQVCFILVTSISLPWQLADDACADAYNGNLVTVLNATTDTIVRELLANYTSVHGSPPGDVWIGGFREETGEPWRRDSDRAVTSGQGCYKDVASSRDLPLDVTASLTSVTATNCRNECKARFHLYAGVQNGNLCFCGNSYGRYGAVACAGIPCEGDSSESCGGTSHNFVYAVNGEFSAWNKDTPDLGTYQSCVVMQKSFDMEFDDDRCSASHPYLCQIDGAHNSSTCSAVDQTAGDVFVVDSVCYYIGIIADTWFGARMACKERDGKLAEITSRETLTKLNTEINNVQSFFSKIFIGYTNLFWSWKTGYEMVYTNFASGKPDTQANRHLAYFYNNGDFQWTDADGDSSKHYICETGLADAPTTTTTSTVAPSPIVITTETVTTTASPSTSATAHTIHSTPLQTTAPVVTTTEPSTTSSEATIGTGEPSTTGTETIPSQGTTVSKTFETSMTTSQQSMTASAVPTTTSEQPTTETSEASTSTKQPSVLSSEQPTSVEASTTTFIASTGISTSILENSGTTIASTSTSITTADASFTSGLPSSADTTTSDETSSSSSVVPSTSATPETSSSATLTSIVTEATTSTLLTTSGASESESTTSQRKTTGLSTEGQASTPTSESVTSGQEENTATTTPKPTFIQTTSTSASTPIITTTASGGNPPEAGAQTGDDGSGLSVLEIVLVVVVCVLVLLVILIIILFFCWKKNNRLNRVYVEDTYDGRNIAGIPSSEKLDFTYGYGNYGSQDALVPHKNTRASQLEDTEKYRVNMDSGSNSTLA